MSRIGRKAIKIPSGVKVDYSGRVVSIQGPKGNLTYQVPQLVELKVSSESIQVEADYVNNQQAKTLMGTTGAVLKNMVVGVSEGFNRKLVMSGVGYKAAVSGSSLDLSLGFSHPLSYPLPQGVQAKVDNNTEITLSSHDKVLLGQTAAKIRSFRPPEPYLGKGVAYAGEKIRRKAGKTGKK